MNKRDDVPQHGFGRPFLVFTGNETGPLLLKSALGVVDWAPEQCIAQWRTSDGGYALGLPMMGAEAAVEAGAVSLLIGIAPFGGQIQEDWVEPLISALEAGLDIVSGLHTKLSDHKGLAAAAERTGRTLYDIRHPISPIPLATGVRRSGKRLLTVGTDCNLGKKYTALALTRELRDRGIDADFRATGQTGIMIAGGGIAIDGVIADFIAGAAEILSPEAAADHWDVIEGQGALFHPAYAGVTLGLLHGSQPDRMVMCHDPSRLHLANFPDVPIKTPGDLVTAYEMMAQLTNAGARVAAISINSSLMELDDAKAYADRLEREVGMPCFDPMRFGLATAVDAILQ